VKFFKIKNPKKEFFCALCRAPRALKYERHLTQLNYLQIIILTVAITAVSYNTIGFRGLSSFFIIWAAFESTRKMLYRKDLPCTYCGFDPTWYRRDVRVARKKVEDFLKENPEARVFPTEKIKENNQHFRH
jgi:hypothetical protein